MKFKIKTLICWIRGHRWSKYSETHQLPLRCVICGCSKPWPIDRILLKNTRFKGKIHEKTPVTPWVDSQNDRIVANLSLVDGMVEGIEHHRTPIVVPYEGSPIDMNHLPPQFGFSDEIQYGIGTQDNPILETIFDEHIANLPFEWSISAALTPEQSKAFLEALNTELRKPSEVTIEYYLDGKVTQLTILGKLQSSETDPYTHTLVADPPLTHDKIELLKKLFGEKEES